jgi:uncharacterized protein YhaN
VKLDGWSIDGFGVFSDYEVSGLSPGLTVLLGPNEAGKSTLLAFVRGVLFGFPDRRNRESQHPPLTGGRHGGRLHLRGPDGVYVVEREAGRRVPPQVILPDGSLGSSAHLGALLGGVDKALFRSVFAFGLGELQSFESLTEDGVGDRIFSAGIVGAGRSARQAVTALEAAAAQRWRPRGDSQVARLLREAESLDQQLAAARAAATGYPEAVERQAALERTHRTALAELVRLRRRSADLERLRELWPAWSELEHARRALAGLPDAGPVPLDGRERLAAALADVGNASAALRDASDARDEAAVQLAALTVDDDLAAAAGEAAALADESALALALDQQAETASGHARAAGAALDAALGRLGPDWDADRAAALDRWLLRREEIRGHQTALATARDAAGERRRELAEAEGRVARADEACAEAALPDEPLDRASLATQEAAVRSLRAGLVELGRAEDAVGRAQDALEHERAVGHTTPVRSAGLLAVAVAALLVAGVAAALAQPALGIGLAAAGLVAAVAALVRSRRRAHAHVDDGSLGRREAEVARTTTAVDRLRDRLADDALQLGLDDVPDARSLEERDRELAHALDERRDYDAALQLVERLERERKVASTAREAAAAGVEMALRREADANDAWARWCREAGLPAALRPEGAIDFVAVVGEAVEHLRARDEAADEAAAALRRVEAWRERAVAALGAGDGAPPLPELVARLRVLRERCEADARQRRARDSAERALAGLERAHAAAELRSADADAALAALLGEAGAGDEEAFRARLDAAEQRAALELRIEELDALQAARLGLGDEADAARRELATGAVAAWEREAVEVADALVRAEEIEREAIRDHRDAELARQALERSSDVAALEGQRAALAAELAVVVHAFRVELLAARLVADTLRTYTEERQPRVLEQASDLFSRVTRRRYDRLVQDEDGRSLTVIGRHGSMRRGLGELSRGTAEQLYLCVRLALAAEYAQRSAELPLVIDDCLVNFDPQRQLAMTRAIAAYAAERQVLLFTCHPSVRDIVLQADPHAGVIEIGAEPRRPALVAVQQTLAV